MGILPACLCTMCMPGAHRVQRGHQILRYGVTDGYELLMVILPCGPPLLTRVTHMGMDVKFSTRAWVIYQWLRQ